MFNTEICRVVAESVSGKMTHAIQSIQGLNLDEASRELELVADIVIKKADNFCDDYPDEVFNDVFILKRFVNLLKDYVSYWKLLVSGKYSESWSALQDVQDRLRAIYRLRMNQDLYC